MEIIRLEQGKAAPVDTDCISLETRPDGRIALTGSALCGGESVALVGHPLFDNVEAAEEAGLVWAKTQGVERVFVMYDPAEIASD